VTDDKEDMLTIKEINKVLKHAKNRKSRGLDKLPILLWKFWRKLIKSAHTPFDTHNLTTISNTCYNK
jgi:hypothetical protein